MGKFIIYGLVDPRTEAIRYVGMSSSGLTRPKSHGQSGLNRQGHRTNWILELRNAGFNYEIRVLEEVANQSELPTREVLWIAHLRAAGHHLTNHTDGGEGTPGYRPEAEARHERSERMKDWRPSPAMIEAARRTWTGRKHSEETRKKMSLSHSGYVTSAETKQKISAIHAGKKLSSEHRAKISRAKIGKPRPDARDLRLGVPRSEATRAKVAAGVRKWWQNKRASSKGPRLFMNLLCGDERPDDV